MRVVVGRVVRAHGIRGEVAVDVHTDDPDERFAPGAELSTDPESVGPLRVGASRWHGRRLLVAFDGTDDRTAAEVLRGTWLLADADADADAADTLRAGSEEYPDRELVGLAALTSDGEQVGVVADVLHLPAQDVLVLTTTDGGEALVPFVSSIVPVVDVPGGRVVLEPPRGLLDPDEAE